jgi:hypothetical protein
MFCVLLLLFYNKMTNKSLSFSYNSMEFFINILDLGYNGTYKFKYIFWIFRIFLEVHIVQFGITLRKHAEIHLNDKK